jgi:16S rRNA processing protein RimM
MRLARSRRHSQGLLVAFEGIANPEAAAGLRNQLVLVRADDRPPLEDGEYYHHQLLGLQVITEVGSILGELVEILETGANDVYVVRPQQGNDILLPAIEEVVLSIDLPAGQICVRPLPGLLSEE